MHGFGGHPPILAVSRARAPPPLVLYPRCGLYGPSKTHAAYRMPDGQYVITDRTKILPKNVRADMKARASEALRKASRSRDVQVAFSRQTEVAIAQHRDLSAQRSVVSVLKVWTSDPDSGAFPTPYQAVWSVVGGRANGRIFSTRAAAVADAQHLIAHKKHPLQYTLVVAEDW